MDEMKSFCLRLPKIELHAHLNGSLSDKTILALIDKKRQKGIFNLSNTAEVTIHKGHSRTLSECFDVFKVIHTLIDSIEIVGEITRDVIREFAYDNVRYLELRTTPKAVEGRMTKKQYLQAVLDAIIHEEKETKICVRLLVSIDRGRGLNDAHDTVAIIKDYLKHDKYGRYICGFDISGNPSIGSLVDYIDLMHQIKVDLGLKLSVHLAELSNMAEVVPVLESGLIDRVGHGTFIHPMTGGSQNLARLMQQSGIPIEICLTSNVKTGTVTDATQHHLSHWIKDGHPVVICLFDVDRQHLKELTLNAVNHTFLTQDEKYVLMTQITEEMKEL